MNSSFSSEGWTGFGVHENWKGLAITRSLLAEYDLACLDTGLPSRVQEIIEKHKKHEELTWGDLYLLEKYVVCKQPEEVLRARLPALRLNFRRIVGADAYEQYLQSRQAAQPDGSEQQLRADAGRLLDTLHWAYAMAPEREGVRSAILKNIALEMALSVGLRIVAVLFAAFYLKMTLVPTVILVLLMGALGGFLSVQQRLGKILTEQDPILTMFQLQNGRFAVRLAPLLGAICAFALFLVFQAGLLKGSVFPDMDKLNLGLGELDLGLGKLNFDPEYGKLLLWCFIAGFAERFVPDILDNLISKRGETTAPNVGKGEDGAAARSKPSKSPALTAEPQLPPVGQKPRPRNVHDNGAKPRGAAERARNGERKAS